jgi:hypothetical protein
MPEATVVETPVVPAVETPVVTPSTETPSLGWRAGLPDDLKQNTDLANYKTVGDFTKEALSWKGKVSELEGKLSDSIPKLPADATDEDRNTFLDALGRPQKASEYEFDGEDKNAPEWTDAWKQDFYQEGLTKQQALNLSKVYNARINKMVDDFKAHQAKELQTAEQALRTEMGDKYDTNVELAKRMYSKQLGAEFDADFADAPPKARFGMTRLLLKMAALTGEDTSPQGGHSTGTTGIKPEDAWMQMYKNPVGRK